MPFIGGIFLPYFIWIQSFRNKRLEQCYFFILLLAFLSVSDQEIISTDKFRILVSLKFILFIATFASISLLISLNILKKIFFAKDIEPKDIVDFTMSLICCISFFCGVILYNSKSIFYSFGDYYQTILYLPLQILGLSFYVISLWIVNLAHTKFSRELIYILLIFSLSLIIKIVFNFLSLSQDWNLFLIEHRHNNYAILLYILMRISNQKLFTLLFFMSVILSCNAYATSIISFSAAISYILHLLKINKFAIILLTSSLILIATKFGLVDIFALKCDQYNLVFENIFSIDFISCVGFFSNLVMLISIMIFLKNNIYACK
jgi:hypothetical protein